MNEQLCEYLMYCSCLINAWRANILGTACTMFLTWENILLKMILYNLVVLASAKTPSKSNSE